MIRNEQELQNKRDIVSEEDLVSIIVPVYNAQPYIDRCLESICRQTYKKIQIIVVDDGSSDNSGKICDEYADRDSRILVLHTDNKGSVAARKAGLKHAKGEYIGFVDSDDYADLNMFEVLVNSIKESGADFVHSGYKEIADNYCEEVINFTEGIYQIDTREERKRIVSDLFLDVKNGGSLSYSLWSKLYKREIICKCFDRLKDKQQLGEDMLCLCWCLLESKKIQLLGKAMYNYTVRAGSLSHLSREDTLKKQIKCCALFLEIMEESGYDEELTDDINEFCASFLLPTFKRINSGKRIIQQYYFSEIEELYNKKVVLYGAGAVGKDFYEELCHEKRIEVICMVDSNVNTSRRIYNGIEIKSKEELMNLEYDIILISVMNEKDSKEIYNQLISIGVVDEKIVWYHPKRLF